MTVRYVDGLNGLDSNDGLSEANAKKTLQAAVALMLAAGDITYVENSATYTETITTGTSATGNSPMMVIGYATGGTPEINITKGVYATIDAQSTRANCVAGTTDSHWVWVNMRFTGATTDCYDDVNADYLTFINCRFDNAGADGIQVDNYASLYYCTMDNNSSEGAALDADSAVLCCRAYNNGSWAATGVGGGHVVGCLAYNNGGGFYHTGSNPSSTHMYNTVDQVDGGTGLQSGQTASSYAAINNIITNAGSGILVGTASEKAFANANLFFGNTTDRDADLYYGDDDVVGDPLFTDSANGDYTIGGASPAVDAGLPPRELDV
jgi:hypothetical protein